MLNGVDVKVKLHRSKNPFCLMSSTQVGYKVHMEDASILVRKVKVNPSIAIAHAKALEHGTAKYPVRRVEVKTLTIPTGNLSFTRESLFNGIQPSRLIVGLVSTEAFNGSYQLNPFNFHHYETNFVALHLDGETHPWIQPVFGQDGADDSYMLAYHTLFTGLNDLFENKGHLINREDFAHGYTLFAFDLSPDLSSNKAHFNLVRQRNLSLEIKFALPLPHTVN
ncbi:uncharacterized protein F54H12.2-like, partial [Anneissia japonica]|uniref:uncharacterized protein F54H12.2-like n=1 Tax=Anneissia japonica TaxID=1529436 RepID=UPI00142552EE